MDIMLTTSRQLDKFCPLFCCSQSTLPVHGYHLMEYLRLDLLLAGVLEVNGTSLGSDHGGPVSCVGQIGWSGKGKPDNDCLTRRVDVSGYLFSIMSQMLMMMMMMMMSTSQLRLHRLYYAA